MTAKIQMDMMVVVILIIKTILWDCGDFWQKILPFIDMW